MQAHKLSPEQISKCSPRHIQSVIEDLVAIIKLQNKLANDVLSLNPKCNEIGSGKLANMQEIAQKIIDSE